MQPIALRTHQRVPVGMGVCTTPPSGPLPHRSLLSRGDQRSICLRQTRTSKLANSSHPTFLPAFQTAQSRHCPTSVCVRRVEIGDPTIDPTLPFLAPAPAPAPAPVPAPIPQVQAPPAPTPDLDRTHHAEVTPLAAPQEGAMRGPDAAPTGRVARPRRSTAVNHDYNRLSKVGTTVASSKLSHSPHPFLTVYRVSLGQALQDPTRLTDTIDAARKELVHLYTTLQALKPVRYKDILERKQTRHIINGHLFFKDKFAADGSYLGRKGRLVMNGNEESPDDLEDTRSPAIDPISLLTALSIAAHYPKCEQSTYKAPT